MTFHGEAQDPEAQDPEVQDPEDSAGADFWETESGGAARLTARLTPASSASGCRARVSLDRLGTPLEFSDADAFVQFLQRVAEHGLGLK
jgi:hypothetical protein